MATELKTLVVRRRTPEVDMVWFDGTNAVEVARWLIDHGKSQVDVHFKQGDLTLSLNGYRREIPDGCSGIWLDSKGEPRRRDEIKNHYDILSGTA